MPGYRLGTCLGCPEDACELSIFFALFASVLQAARYYALDFVIASERRTLLKQHIRGIDLRRCAPNTIAQRLHICPVAYWTTAAAYRLRNLKTG